MLKDQIKKLVDLQKIDSEVFAIRSELNEKPALIAEMAEEFETQKSKLKGWEEKLKQVLLKRKEVELELKTKEESIVKATGSLSTLKTNKEYTAKLAEIESIKADKSVVEDQILKFYDEGDVIQKEIDQEKKIVAEKEKVFAGRKKEIEDHIRLLEDKVKVLDVQRQQYLPEVDKNLLSRYEKILNHKDGLAIAPVKDGICGGCNMNITPQMINVIKGNAEIVECDMCSRILYLEDNL